MKPPPAPFAIALDALNGEGSFAPGAVTAQRLVKLPDGRRVTETVVKPYWVRLREEAYMFRVIRGIALRRAAGLPHELPQEELSLPPDAEYQKAQRVFVRKLRDLVEKWRDADRNSAARRDLQKDISVFLRREPLQLILSIKGPPSLLSPVGPFAVKRFLRGKDRPAIRARREALQTFIGLIRHPILERRQLGNCQRCARYFFGRIGQKCCPRPRRCGSYLAAIEATKRQWKARRAEKLALAQKACAEWKVRKPKTAWKPWVANRVGVTPKWITRAVNEGALVPFHEEGENTKATRNFRREAQAFGRRSLHGKTASSAVHPPKKGKQNEN